MTYTIHQSQIRTLKPSDPNFVITDRLMVAPRAGVEISNKCPREYKLIIAECINNGWIQPVANVTERELIFTGLTK